MLFQLTPLGLIILITGSLTGPVSLGTRTGTNVNVTILIIVGHLNLLFSEGY